VLELKGGPRRGGRRTRLLAGEPRRAALRAWRHVYLAAARTTRSWAPFDGRAPGGAHPRQRRSIPKDPLAVHADEHDPPRSASSPATRRRRRARPLAPRIPFLKSLNQVAGQPERASPTSGAPLAAMGPRVVGAQAPRTSRTLPFWGREPPLPRRPATAGDFGQSGSELMQGLHHPIPWCSARNQPLSQSLPWRPPASYGTLLDAGVNTSGRPAPLRAVLTLKRLRT